MFAVDDIAVEVGSIGGSASVIAFPLACSPSSGDRVLWRSGSGAASIGSVSGRILTALGCTIHTARVGATTKEVFARVLTEHDDYSTSIESTVNGGGMISKKEENIMASEEDEELAVDMLIVL